MHMCTHITSHFIYIFLNTIKNQSLNQWNQQPDKYPIQHICLIRTGTSKTDPIKEGRILYSAISP